jgi:predicted esterase
MRNPFCLVQDHRRRSRKRFQPVRSDAGAWATPLEARTLLSSLGPVEIRARAAVAVLRGEGAQAIPARAERPQLDRTTVPQVRTTGVTSQPDALIYVPPGLRPGRTYPLLVVFNAGGDPSNSLRYWKSLARRNDWIIYASSEFSNAAVAGSSGTAVTLGPGDPTNYNRLIASHYQDPNLLARIKSHIDGTIARLPVDRSRIILAGFSGGAFFAHDLNASYPGFAAAVIDNSNGEPVLGPGDAFEEPIVPTAGAFTASRRVAIFLVGEDDPTFLSQVKEAISVYQQRWGWPTLFMTFPGGHKPAPAKVMKQAIGWLLSRPSWA